MKYTEKELQQEVWRDVFGYDGAYQVSDLGRVRSKMYGRWKVMKQRKIGKGYLGVNLYKDGKRKTVNVHRLVAQAFIENDNIFNTEVNHRNEDKTDNRSLNLEWCDRHYNMNYNGLHRRCINKRDNYIRPKIEKLYDPNLSYKQNFEIFKANGIECGRETVRRLRNDLGLTKKKIQ